ncbi:acyltransferase family protein [Legionella fallonii]|uniref:Acyltransferase n=1 Tax=Legionella fallonii LLAP-10 TaxID=1212491 RepID=A0A098GAJ3_9GAMM|nr:acyltransferase family protein [Legionella fallonii]CEG59002.1 Acyltransferase [Legionella fallonii LLAP-10]
MSYQPHVVSSDYRADIDGLRGVAVLSVVAYHAFPHWFQGGFIGVDVFFVISGYLISTIIFKNLDQGTFSFKEFYIRRIKRIFPALILILIFCLVFGWFALLPDEYKQLGKHILGSTGFVQNMVLWGETGYFDNSAETKPLLHIWSLGVEEQFYFIWPLFIWFAWIRKFNLLLVTIFAALTSFILNIKGINDNFVATFYLPHTRFWELLSGGLLAWINLYGTSTYQQWNIKGGILSAITHKNFTQSKWVVLSNALSFLGIILLCCGFLIINKKLNFPGKWAIIPVLGTVLIIYSGSGSWINRVILSNRIIVWFGLISFPLYLWHWPILSFIRITESETPGWNIRIAAIVLATVLAWLTYRLVECPIRWGQYNRIKVVSLVVLMTLIAGLGYQDYIRDGYELRFPYIATEQNLQHKNIDFSSEARENCKQRFPKWEIMNDNPCLLQQKAHNSIAIIGDSHAGQLFTGMSKHLASNHDGVAVFSASCAVPLIDISSGISDANVYNIRKDAYKLIASAYDYVMHDPEIKTVIMAHNPQCSYGDAVDVTNLGNKNYRNVLEVGMRRTFSKLIQSGKEVFVLFDNPGINFDPKRCQWRPFRLINNDDKCSFPRKMFDENPVYSSYRLLVKKVLKDYPQIKTFDLSELLCDKKTCYIAKNGHTLYADINHLNGYGSEFVAPYLLSAIGRA